MVLSSALLWIDLETAGLPEGNDYSDCRILEVGALLTSTSLELIEEISGVVMLDGITVETLRKDRNRDALEMHKQSGLLAALKGDTQPLRHLEVEILSAIEEHVKQGGKIVLAGSGVASFDQHVIREFMPELAQRLEYYVFDVGAARRVNRMLSHGRFHIEAAESYGDLKEHRALADIYGHYKEALKMREEFGRLYDTEN